MRPSRTKDTLCKRDHIVEASQFRLIVSTRDRQGAEWQSDATSEPIIMRLIAVKVARLKCA